MAESNSFLAGIGDVFDTVMTNASGIADVINAVNKNGTASTLATPGAPAAPTANTPAANAAAPAGMSTGAKAAIAGGVVVFVGFLVYLFTGRRRR